MDAELDRALALVEQTWRMTDQTLGLPTGTVTFLLTDVEGSTRGWEERPDQMGALIARHYAVIGDAVADYDGVRPQEQGEGDSTVSAFRRPAQALAAAVAAQRRLLDELPELRVRMAIHTGEVELRDESNYVGRTIIRCARLRGVAHGGQIVVSDATAGLVADDLGECALFDVGHVRLRDLARPERVWQLTAPGLPARFGPLRSLDTAPHNLPTAVTSFVGRDQELAEVTALVRSHALVTLTGSGGCGKTRLALHTAGDMSSEHDGGTWWTDLATVADAATLPDAVASAVGVSIVPGADLVDLLVQHVRDQPSMLVVLDNAEHLTDRVAELVHRLVSNCPGLRVLVTSREPLGLTNEVVWRVPSLSVPPVQAPLSGELVRRYAAVELLIDRARHVRPNLAVDDATLAHVVAICRRLDGLPLALELAAARVRTLPIERVVRGLDDAFRLLTGGTRAALPRQQTLLASITWSVDLLAESERAALRRMSVFHGSFTLEAAEAVIADGDLIVPYDALELVSRLVDKNLVQLDDSSGRYRLLETIRQFSLDRLREAGEVLESRRRHAVWCAEWSEALARGEHSVAIAPDGPDLPDVFAALEWCYEDDPSTAYRIIAGVGWVRHNIGRLPEFERQYTWVAAQNPLTDPAGWARGVAGLSVGAVANGYVDFVVLAERAEPLLEAGDVRSRRMLRNCPAVMSCFLGDPAELRAMATDAHMEGDDQALRQTATTLSIVEVALGELDRADDLFGRLARMLQRHGLPFTSASALVGAAQAALVLAYRGDVRGAVASIDLTGSRDAAHVFATAATASMVAYHAGDAELAAAAVAYQAAARSSLLAYGRSNDRPNPLEPTAMGAPSQLAMIEGRWHDAVEQAEIVYRHTILSPAVKSFLARPFVVALLTVGRAGEAESIIQELTTDVARLGWPALPAAHLAHLRALLASACGEDDDARRHAHECLQVAHGAGLRLVAIDALELVAHDAFRRGHDATAARLFGAIATERDRGGYRAVNVPDREALQGAAAAAHSAAPEGWAEGAALSFADAVAYAQRARGERGRPSTGWASLTATEQKVAALVAAGRSNDEVATELLMGTATVKTHLTHIYTKVGVRNRAALAAAYAAR